MTHRTSPTYRTLFAACFGGIQVPTPSMSKRPGMTFPQDVWLTANPCAGIRQSVPLVQRDARSAIPAKGSGWEGHWQPNWKKLTFAQASRTTGASSAYSSWIACYPTVRGISPICRRVRSAASMLCRRIVADPIVYTVTSIAWYVLSETSSNTAAPSPSLARVHRNCCVSGHYCIGTAGPHSCRPLFPRRGEGRKQPASAPDAQRAMRAPRLRQRSVSCRMGSGCRGRGSSASLAYPCNTNALG
jgi:hypothetical protein